MTLLRHTKTAESPLVVDWGEGISPCFACFTLDS